MKNCIKNIALILMACFFWLGCKVYSFTGASIAGKTMNVQNLQNNSANVVPTLSPTLTDKIRSRILSQTGLAPVQGLNADYELSGAITGYNVTISGLGSAERAQASQNRLTITVQIEFKNKLDPKASFKQSFSRFADFGANQQLQSVENKLIEDIGNQLADDIFNKAFVNW
ncbi:LptE family protein [Edaphocola aurantiacus]|uniref:LptE family protein n=1 Tax=Edaphocola aurantiacus TaxID=2601682 RepID=UPI001C98A78B|nr:LptE family protein [Edaphocola aurantiacus]